MNTDGASGRLVYTTRRGPYDAPFVPPAARYAGPGPGVFGDHDFTVSGPMPPASLAIVQRLAHRCGVSVADLLLCALDAAILFMLGPDADEETMVKQANQYREAGKRWREAKWSGRLRLSV